MAQDSAGRTTLDGHVALVTGASRGIGAAIALRLAAGGARVVVNYRSSPDQAAAVIAAIHDAGGEARAVQADVSDPDQIEALFDAAEATFGRVSLLVTNAADRGTPTPAAKVDAAAVDRMFGMNVRGPVLCIAAFAQRAGDGGGRVVTITSGQARTPMPGAGLYAGTNGAMEAITRAFAADLGPAGITVNGVAPGATATDTFTREVPEDVQKKTVEATALGRLGAPDDIADAVAFLLSDAARWVTGQILHVNGGLRR